MHLFRGMEKEQLDRSAAWDSPAAYARRNDARLVEYQQIARAQQLRQIRETQVLDATTLERKQARGIARLRWPLCDQLRR